jgi:RNA polymerase sigma-70 factor (ECF subfamily)
MKDLLDDKEIIELFNQGGNSIDAAFRGIVAKYSERLYSQIRRITRNHEHTNDVLQNVLIKVYQNLDSFNQDSTLYTWMYRIARNETLNFIDKEKRRTGVDLDESIMEIVAGHHVLDSTTPEMISSILEEAVDSLPEKQAMVFQLKYFEDLKYSEISKQLNISEGALKANFHHAKQKIETFILFKLNH